MAPLGDCNPGSIARTFALGVGLGGVAGALIAIGAHLLHALSSSSGAATQPLVMSIMLSTFGGFVFGIAASVGALLALWIGDSRLRRSALVQGLIAGTGAVVPGVAVFAVLGQTASVDIAGSLWLFALIFGSAFGLMILRAKAHRAGSLRLE